MTKDQYLELREKEEVPLELFYNYWVEVKPSHYKNMSFEEFERNFSQFLFNLQGNIVLSEAGQKIVDFPRMLERIYSHFNEKFKV
jgi:hypothetical protein